MENAKSQKSDFELYFQLAIIGILVILIAYNAGQVYGNTNISGAVTSIGTVSALDFLPTGIPEVYGEELGVSYDDVSANTPQAADATIKKLSEYESSELTDVQMANYIEIGMAISCEHCCGAKAIISSKGDPACGCAHSYAMRGLAKYLLQNHPQMSNDEILEELGKWKVLFFPGIHETKAGVLQSQGIELNYINLASNKYRGIEKGQTSSSSMAGGC